MVAPTLSDMPERQREMHAARHMSDFEALMWNLDKDPRLSSTIGNLSILDGPIDMDRFRRRLERAVFLVPRLHQRVVPGFGRLAPPSWHTDPDLDVDHHLRWISLGGDATRRQLYETVVQLMSDPFNRSRPLWEFVVIDGLAGGRSAMLQKLHHTLTDGKGGLRISEQFVDFERDAPEHDPVPAPDGDPIDSNLLTTVSDTMTHVARRGLGAARRSLDDVSASIRNPSEVVRFGREGVAVAGSAIRQVRPDHRQCSPLWHSRSLRRWFGTIDFPLDEARRVAKAFDVSINDVFVAGAAGGASRYHLDRGIEVEELRMAMPISTRRDTSAGGNMFGLSQTLVPTGDMPVADRLVEVGQRLSRTKDEAVVGAAEGLAGLVNLLPTSVVVRSGFRLAASVDFVTSNLRAAPVDLFIGGALMEGNYPLGPLSGTAFNLTTMSYRGVLDMGLVVDAGAIAEPEELRRAIELEYAALAEASA
jgi:WS/DGAT/MGAT family acyltransferase